jgi:lipid-binding SYLF domain-containing protein
MSIEHKARASAIACAAALTLCGLAQAQTPAPAPAPATRAANTDPASKPHQSAEGRVTAALDVVPQIEAEPRMKQLLQQAKGILIVPKFGRAALGVGAQGGAGLLLLKRADGSWSSPAFYDLGGMTIGLQAGGEGGAIAMVLNNDKAVDQFMKKNGFSLNADAGLTVVNWSKLATGTAGAGDVVAWSGTKGLFGDAVAVGLTGIHFNEKLTNAYYGRTVSPKDITNASVSNAQAKPLQQALGRASGHAG